MEDIRWDSFFDDAKVTPVKVSNGDFEVSYKTYIDNANRHRTTRRDLDEAIDAGLVYDMATLATFYDQV